MVSAAWASSSVGSLGKTRSSGCSDVSNRLAGPRRLPVPTHADAFLKARKKLHFGYATVRIGAEGLNLFELIDQSTTVERKKKFAWTMVEAPKLGSVRRPGY